MLTADHSGKGSLMGASLVLKQQSRHFLQTAVEMQQQMLRQQVRVSMIIMMIKTKGLFEQFTQG